MTIAPALLDELEAVLSRERFRTWVSMKQVEAHRATIRDRAELVGDPVELTPVSRDPDDDNVVALARWT